MTRDNTYNFGNIKTLISRRKAIERYVYIIFLVLTFDHFFPTDICLQKPQEFLMLYLILVMIGKFDHKLKARHCKWK